MRMDICHGNHEEIVFNGISCPLCWYVNVKIPSIREDLGLTIDGLVKENIRLLKCVEKDKNPYSMRWVDRRENE